MAYVVVSFKGQEVGRWPLKGPLTVGRSTECDVVVRDILLSRRHCEIAPYRNGWIARDLGSKNGTMVGRHPITRRGLTDGDVLKLGKTTVRFQIGRLPAEHKPPAKRPADPFEALSGTVTDFDPKAAEAYCQDNNLPKPQPIPPEPAGYSKDDLYSLLTEIASSSWDSIYAGASQPVSRFAEESAPAGTTLVRTRVRAEAFDPRLEAPSPVRRKRPALPPNVGQPSRVRAVLRAVARPFVAMHRWVSPRGAVLLF